MTLPIGEIICGDSLEVLKAWPDGCVDCCICDPPYGLSFMGKKWDYQVPSVEIWREVWRVLKDGGRLLAFSGARTQHRMVCNIEDAGFTIEDCMMWLYGSGFPKHGSKLKPAYEPICVARKGKVSLLNIDAARIDPVGYSNGGQNRTVAFNTQGLGEKQPRCDGSAGRWPANVCLDEAAAAMLDEQSGMSVSKPHEGGLISSAGSHEGYKRPSHANGYKPWSPHSDSGGASRFFKTCAPDCPLCCLPYTPKQGIMSSWLTSLASIAGSQPSAIPLTRDAIARLSAAMPLAERLVQPVKSAANLCDSCGMSIAAALAGIKTKVISSEESLAILGCTGSSSASILNQNLVSFAELWASIDTIPTTTSLSLLFGFAPLATASSTRQESQGSGSGPETATRCRYVAKASASERNSGLSGMPERESGAYGEFAGDGRGRQTEHAPAANHHPTVKPLALMRWLVNLTTFPGEIVLDCFAGSGSTLAAAERLGRRWIGIEIDESYCQIARKRTAQKGLALCP